MMLDLLTLGHSTKSIWGVAKWLEGVGVCAGCVGEEEGFEFIAGEDAEGAG